jgi:hypothetical protein
MPRCVKIDYIANPLLQKEIRDDNAILVREAPQQDIMIACLIHADDMSALGRVLKDEFRGAQS